MSENTKIEDLEFLGTSLKSRLKGEINTVKDFLDYSFYDLLKIEGLCLADVACIVFYLHMYGYHIKDEEDGILTLEDYSFVELEPLLMKCEALLKERNGLLKYKGDNYLEKVKTLNQSIFLLLNQMFDVKDECLAMLKE